jgi:hypothetical protein
LKINWNIAAIVLPLLVGLIGWGVTVETRIDRALDVDARLSNIEELLRPLLVEYEVRKRLDEMYSTDPMTAPPEPEPETPQVREEIAREVDDRIKQWAPPQKR